MKIEKRRFIRGYSVDFFLLLWYTNKVLFCLNG